MTPTSPEYKVIPPELQLGRNSLVFRAGTPPEKKLLVSIETTMRETYVCVPFPVIDGLTYCISGDFRLFKFSRLFTKFGIHDLFALVSLL